VSLEGTVLVVTVRLDVGIFGMTQNGSGAGHGKEGSPGLIPEAFNPH
jgi:hypothetical protein